MRRPGKTEVFDDPGEIEDETFERSVLLRIGQPDLLDLAPIAAAGDAIFSNLGLLFAITLVFNLVAARIVRRVVVAVNILSSPWTSFSTVPAVTDPSKRSSCRRSLNSRSSPEIPCGKPGKLLDNGICSARLRPLSITTMLR
mgnify:CR=1 FL=1